MAKAIACVYLRNELVGTLSSLYTVYDVNDVVPSPMQGGAAHGCCGGAAAGALRGSERG